MTKWSGLQQNMREGGCEVESSKTLGDALNNVCTRTVKFEHLDSGEFAASGFAPLTDVPTLVSRAP